MVKWLRERDIDSLWDLRGVCERRLLDGTTWEPVVIESLSAIIKVWSCFRVGHAVAPCCGACFIQEANRSSSAVWPPVRQLVVEAPRAKKLRTAPMEWPCRYVCV